MIAALRAAIAWRGHGVNQGEHDASGTGDHRCRGCTQRTGHRRGVGARSVEHAGGRAYRRIALEKAINHISPTVNAATCSAGVSLTAAITLLDGTGLYKGIGGTLKDTEFVGFISPRYTSGKDKGQCNLNTQPTAQLGLVVATGSVSFGG